MARSAVRSDRLLDTLLFYEEYIFQQRREFPKRVRRLTLFGYRRHRDNKLKFIRYSYLYWQALAIFVLSFF